MLAELLEQIQKAEMITGHNLEWFDLPVINAECMQLGLKPIRSVLVQDTKRLAKSKGFPKSQSNLLARFDSKQQKMELNWQKWMAAYDEPGWKTIRERCESDVRGHKEMRQELISLGYMKVPREWVGIR
jgi:hypothetical protein